MAQTITSSEKKAIKRFYDAVADLKRLKVIRSDKYLGDIAEFLCQRTLGVVLAESSRHPDYDGLIDKSKVQIKFSGGTSNTVNCGNPSKYTILLIVVGKDSKLRRKEESGSYLIYKLSNKQVKTFKKNDGNYHCGKTSLPLTPLLRL